MSLYLVKTDSGGVGPVEHTYLVVAETGRAASDKIREATGRGIYGCWKQRRGYVEVEERREK